MEQHITIAALVAAIVCSFATVGGAADDVKKPGSVFYPARLLQAAKENAEKYEWAREHQAGVVAAAGKWLEMSYDELWELMFSHTVERAWMVLSDGYCPACKEDVLMYQWKQDTWGHPWKVQCPHCDSLFPTNDFNAFRKSGLDRAGIFQRDQADESLLYNAEHPDPEDPKHKFGVDDGSGYTEGARTWHFIGGYLTGPYGGGHWKGKVLAGVLSLADAYVVTGEKEYARRACIILDRVADLYPEFDFRTQGWMYEEINVSNGYVSYWQHAGRESSYLAMAFDKIRSGIIDDDELTGFLSGKARECGLENPKATYADIERNIFDRILVDSINNRAKTSNNFPLREEAVAYMKTVMWWPEKREEIVDEVKGWMATAVQCDGVTGEKGGYSSLGISHIVTFLGYYDRIDPDFISDMLEAVPNLRKTFYFHNDIRVLDAYNILCGDGGSFGLKAGHALGFSTGISLYPSQATLYWRLYEITGDPMFVQMLYQRNGGKTEGLPYDLFCPAPEAFPARVQKVLDEHGVATKLSSVNKSQWCLAIMRSGEGEDRRAAFLDYDSGGRHGHRDGMTIGLYARGINLMPDLGYPPVRFGGWSGPKFDWYRTTKSHPTVVVDGKDNGGSGKSTLWADGQGFHCARASGPNLIKGQQLERTVALIDIDDRDSYLVDVFRVVGGHDHANFVQSTFNTLTTTGLSLKPGGEYGYKALMRDFRTDATPEVGWSADFKVVDRYGYLPENADLHMRYTDLTEDAAASVAESWLAPDGNTKEEVWIPRVMIRRQNAADAPALASTFAGVYEAYEGESRIAGIRRLRLHSEDGKEFGGASLGIEVTLADGRKDLIISLDVENPLGEEPAFSETTVVVQKDWDVRMVGELGLVRLSAAGDVECVVLCRGRSLSIPGKCSLTLKSAPEMVEVELGADGEGEVVAGPADEVVEMRRER